MVAARKSDGEARAIMPPWVPPDWSGTIATWITRQAPIILSNQTGSEGFAST